MPEPIPPLVTFLVASRRRRKDDWQLHNTHDDFNAAKEYAADLAFGVKHYEVAISNSKGLEVWNSRDPAVRYHHALHDRPRFRRNP